MRLIQLSLLLTVLAVAAAVHADDSPQTGAAIHITINAKKAGPPINPYIYGQFIEHLGRCIYGGIWAEMLEDRKFYYPITEKYAPYGDLKNTNFPVVSASPWQATGPAGSVTMVSEKPFSGEHTPRIAAEGGIQQNDLAFVKGANYVGRIRLHCPAGRSGVKILLVLCHNLIFG